MAEKLQCKSMSRAELFAMFPDDNIARTWFEKQIWPNGAICPYCRSSNVQSGIKHVSMTHRCRDCSGRQMFLVRKGTVMEGSRLGYQKWAIAFHLMTENIKDVSSIKLHRDLKITQKSAWRLSHRIRQNFEAAHTPLTDEVKIDETYIGGKERNKYADKKYLARYVSGFPSQHNIRKVGIINKMTGSTRQMVGKRLTYDRQTNVG